MEFTIYFTDGGVLTIKGTIDSHDGIFRLYGEDKMLKYIIPTLQVKYIERNIRI